MLKYKSIILWGLNMYNTNELNLKEKQLLEAYKDPDFEKKLKEVRLSVEEILKAFVVYLKDKLNPEQKIYENIESRVKSTDSFKEKIYRKNYIRIWEVSDDKIANQNLIAENLPDLLGFRINCFFWQDEKVIYSLLKEYYEKGNLLNIKLNFSENTKQENGHTIYKLSGKYNEHFCFEIQIKSIMHNIWGEVEHKTIYKNRNYDADISSKIAITEEVFNILQASDKQLVSLFKKKNDERQLIFALFYEKTKDVIAQKSGTDILAKHYNGYFQVFFDSENIKHIKRYVAYSLLQKDFEKQSVSVDKSDERVKELTALISSEFLEYNLRCLFYICELIYDISDFEYFMLYLSKYLLENYIFEEDDLDESDAFGDSDEENMDYKDSILTMLEDKIGGRKKND